MAKGAVHVHSGFLPASTAPGEWAATLAERAANLLASDEASIPVLARTIREAYDMRNDLVHGDVRSDAKIVRTAVDKLEVWTRQVLVALLRLGGNQSAIIKGVTDPAVRAANRALVRRYVV